MNNTLSRSFLSFLLLFSLFTLSLPQIGYAQTGTQTAASVDYSKQLQAIEEKVEARRKELGIPGMSLVGNQGVYRALRFDDRRRGQTRA